MCKECSICNGTAKMSDEEIIRRDLVTFNGKLEYDGLIPVYPTATCHLCECTWITDVGRFRNW